MSSKYVFAAHMGIGNRRCEALTKFLCTLLELPNEHTKIYSKYYEEDKESDHNNHGKIIKVLFVSHEFGTNGATVSLASMAHGLRFCPEVEVKVLLPYKRGKEGRASYLLRNCKISYKEMLYRNDFKDISKKYSIKYRIFDFINLLAVKRIRKYIHKERFDIVCSNSTGVDVGARAACLAQVPHIYYAREFMKLDFNYEYRNKKQMKKLLEGSNYVIFISKAIEKYYMSNFNLQKTAQFYNGFILSDYYIGNHDILIKDEISFVQVGTFAEGKGTLDTIEILYQLNRSGINKWNMEFIGSGTEEYIQKMQELIEKYHLESQINIGEFCMDMKAKLAKKDILIMNSRAEGFGRVTIEGMLAGCLVMGRDSGGTTEIIMDQINGIIFKAEEEFLKAVNQVIAEKERYRKIAEYGQKYAMENFDCINTAKKFMNVVKNCVK